MKTKLFFLITLSFLTLIGFCQQPQQQIWYLNNQSVDFRVFPPVLNQGLPGNVNVTASTINSARNGVHNKDGELLFYVDGEYIINKFGNLMGTIQNPAVSALRSEAELAIVPVPTKSCQYYIISQYTSATACSGTRRNLSYTLVDMELAGGQGAIVTTNNVINTCNYAGGTAIAVGKLNANNTRFLYEVGIAGSSNDVEVLRYTIDATGVISAPVSIFTDVQGLFASPDEMDLSFNNDKLAFTSLNNLFILHLDGLGNVLTTAGNQVPTNGLAKYTIGGSNLTGVEFSTSGNNLFVGQFNTGIAVVNPNTGTYISLGLGIQNYGNSQLETAYNSLGNNEIYVTDGSNFGKISNPNGVTPSFSGGVLSGYNAIQDLASPTGCYQLPDQIDGYDYSSQFNATTLACCIATSTFNVDANFANTEQNGTQMWNPGAGNNPFVNGNTVLVEDKLIIKTGANITINNMRFEFSPAGQLIIENGARLTINGCTLTVNTNCDANGMWHGVEVWGTGTGTFQPQVSGRFVANNSTIEHAITATANTRHNLDNLGYPYENSFDVTKAGGVIQATNTMFRNNVRGTQFYDYLSMFNNSTFNDQSIFKNCHFITDDYLNNPNRLPFAHADLRRVKNINFKGCTFENTATNKYAVADRGFGIYSIESLFAVSNLCSVVIPFPNTCPTANTDKSEFNNLYYAVYGLGIGTATRTARITNSILNNNFRGILLRNMSLAQVSGNEVNVGNNLAPNQPSYGLYLLDCDKYKVEDNNFTTSLGYYGVYINNSGTGNNEIYNNTFANFRVATQAANKNGAGSTDVAPSGLEFRCNKYITSDDFDILVSSGRVKSDQGLCIANNPQSPANNQFSYFASQGDFWMDINNVSMLSNYFYSPNGSANNVPPRAISTGFSANYIEVLNTVEQVCGSLPSFNSALSCPQRTIKTISELTQFISSNKQVITDLEIVIDGNNTSGLLQLINTTSGGNLKNTLMNASPYLSEDVLMTYITSNPSNGHLKQVLIANSPLSAEVINVLNQQNLPNGIKNQINNAQTGVSAMQQLQSEIGYYVSENDRYTNDILRIYLFDDNDAGDGISDVISYLDTAGCSKSQCLLTCAYLDNADYTAAQQTVNNLSNSVANTDFCNLYNSIIQYEQLPNTEMELLTNNSLLTPIQNVAQATTQNAEVGVAQAILELVNTQNFEETFEYVTVNNSNQRLAPINENTAKVVSNIKVYPNPAKDQFTLTHNLELANGVITLSVFDLMGRKLITETINDVKANISTQKLTTGVYFYTITQNNTTIQSDKLMIK